MSEKLKDGGPAFPVPWDSANNGMSLRDWFAGQALAGMISDSPARRSLKVDGMADAAYAAADAMLAARGEK